MPTGHMNHEPYYRNSIVQVEALSSELSAGVASSAAVTVTDFMGKITTEDLTTAQNASYSLALTNTRIAAGDMIFASLANGTNTQGTPVLVRAVCAANAATIVVKNMHHANEALNGTLVISFFIVKAL